MAEDPAVDGFMSSCGNRGNDTRGGNQGMMFARLKPRSERPPVDEIVQRLRPKLAQVPGIRVYPQVLPPIRLGGTLTRAQYQFTLQASDTKDLYASAPALEEKLRSVKGLQDVNSDLQLRNPDGLSHDRPRPRLRARRHAGIARERALHGVRLAPDLDDLRAEQRVPGHHGAPPRVPARPVGLPAPLRALEEGRPRPALGAHAPRAHRRPARREPRGPAARRHALLQPRARRLARRGRRRDQQGRARRRFRRPSRRASRARRRRSRRRRRGSGCCSSSRSS